MSRIEEALQRAKAAAGAAEPATAGAAPAAVTPSGRDIDISAFKRGLDVPIADTAMVEPDVEAPALDARDEGLDQGPVVAAPAARAAQVGAPPQVDPQTAEKLVIHPEVDPGSRDQFRKLAATLHHAQLERATRIVLVSSASASEGKTLTSVNLALTLCESFDRRVLLIDADLRNPSLHTVFGCPMSPGVSDVVASGPRGALPLVTLTTRLALLPAGSSRTDPVSVLSSERLRRLLHETSTTYDWVILDTAPVGMLPDTNLLSAMADGAVLVVKAGTVSYTVVQRAVEAIGAEKIVGVVLNQVAAGDISATYGDTAAYYAYSRR